MPHRLGDSNAVLLVISLTLTYTVCFAGVRVWIRRNAFGIDDFILAIAIVVSLGHTAADYAALHYGIGTPLDNVKDNGDMSELNESAITGIVTFVASLYLSKSSVLCFLARITPDKKQVARYQLCNALNAFICVASLLCVLITCSPSSGYYWAMAENSSESCPNQSIRWTIFTALDVATEIALLMLPVRLVLSLQMRRNQKKLLLVAFSLRLPTIALSISRNFYTLKLSVPSTDPGRMSGIVIIWFEIQLAYALASSTLSASRSFMEGFNSGFGFGFVREDQISKSSGANRITGKSFSTAKSVSAQKSSNNSVLQEPTISLPYDFADLRSAGSPDTNAKIIPPAKDRADLNGLRASEYDLDLEGYRDIALLQAVACRYETSRASSSLHSRCNSFNYSTTAARDHDKEGESVSMHVH